jgi:hypothetical protein
MMISKTSYHPDYEQDQQYKESGPENKHDNRGLAEESVDGVYQCTT